MSVAHYGEFHGFLQLLPSVSETDQHPSNGTPCTVLPGYPDMAMNDSLVLSEFLQKDIQCNDLDSLSDRLWFMTEQRSANISPLHRQKVKGRDIIVTEEAKLHLVWFYGRIHIKPLPKYLLSQQFWQYMYANHNYSESNKARLRSSALGLLRSYAYLIEYESDFQIAKSSSLSLIPESVGWVLWRRLRSKLLAIRDEEVSPRYSFGEIRLTRLNLYSRLLLHKPYYHRTYRQYGEYFASFYPPLLFLFGIVSVLLGAMQLAATVEEYDARWRGLVGLYRTASAFVMVIASLLLGTLISIFLYKVGKEWVYAWQCRHAKPKRLERKLSKP